MRVSFWRQAAIALLATGQAGRKLFGRLPPYGILKVNLAGDLPEQEAAPKVIAFVRRSGQDYCGVLGVLRLARFDPQLQAVFVHCDHLAVGWARVQGLRRSLLALRKAGKQVWVYLTQPGIREYYLASAADRVFLAPAGTVEITGLSSEVTFLQGTLEKLGIEAEVVQMGRFKAAAETFTRRTMSPAHREMVEAIVDDLYGQIVDGVAEGRGLDPSQCRELLDRGPFLAPEALEAKLIDDLGYEDEAEAALMRACDDAKMIEFRDYTVRRGREARSDLLRRGRGTVGLVHLSGMVKTGENVSGPEGAAAAGATSVARDLKELRDRKDIRAVVLRIASPGGSGLASDLVWREVVRTRELKPVVVSFGDVAASGGYYVGVAGSAVVAEAGTLTGSIGVVAGKVNLHGLLDRLGITREVVSRGVHAALASSYLPLSDSDRERIRAEAEGFYRSFVEKVARGRKLSEDAVDQVAQGRVWTGRQAWARGLVDQVGGLEEALERAKQAIGIAADDLVALERFPKRRRWWKLSLDLGRRKSLVDELLLSFTALRFFAVERVWAILPLQFRFF
jgi:protease-4